MKVNKKTGHFIKVIEHKVASIYIPKHIPSG